MHAPARSFGSLLREYRLAAQMSQEELAERARLSGKTIGALERGERQSPYRDTIDLLATALGLAASERDELERAARRRRVRPVPSEPERGAAHHHRETSARHNLPIEITRLIGRDRALGAVAGLLRGARLVTLVGTGGIGKTRLATAVAASIFGGFPEGAWLVELAAVQGAEAVAVAVATAVGVHCATSRSPRDALIGELRERRLLLILDNCEHVLTEIAHIATDVLAGCAGVTILATSREPLRVRGERVWRVPALSLPDDDSPGALQASASVTLFCERAAAVQPGFAIRPGDVAAMATICRRLDGIPLALELAAPRVGTLSITALARALDDRFGILTGGERAAAPRHQALRTTIAWSCDLLDPRERALFRRAGIFVDGFSLDALVDVCADDFLRETTIFEALASLVDKSLVIADIGEARTRYRMFESTLAFARELLDAAGERAAIAHRHAHVMSTFVRAHAWEMWESPDAGIVADVALELENLRAALRFAFDDGNARALGAQLAVESAAIFRRLDRRVELETRLDALLGGSETSLDPRVEAAANYELLYSMYTPPERQLVAGQRALVLLNATDQAGRHAHASALLALNLAVCFSRYAEARPFIDAALRFARASGDLHLLDQVLRIASQALPPEAREERRCAGAESVALARASGIDRRIADALITAAEVEFAAHDFDNALVLGREALAAQRRIPNRTGLALLLTNVAAYALAAGDLPTADACAREALPISREVDSRLAFLLAIQHLAGVALARDDAGRAAYLLGFVDAGFAGAGFVRETTEQLSYDRDLARIRTQLGAARSADALAIGKLFTDDRALHDAIR